MNLWDLAVEYKFGTAKDRMAARARQGEEAKAATWLEQFAKDAGDPTARSLNLETLPTVVADPMVRGQAKIAADNVLLKRFQADSADLFDPSQIPATRGQIPTPNEARRDIMALAADQQIPPEIAYAATNDRLGTLAADAVPTVIDDGTGKRLYTKGAPGYEKVDKPPTADSSPYKIGARHQYVGQGGKTFEGTYKGLDANSEPIWGNIVQKFEKDTGSSDGGAGSESNRLQWRKNAVEAAKSRLYAIATDLDPEMAQFAKMMGDVDDNVKYTAVRARMTPEQRERFDKVTQRAGELALEYGGDFEKAANKAIAESSPQAPKPQEKGHDVAKDATRFKADPATKGYTMGQYDTQEKGYQVIKNGKIIGYWD
jgi:hypothetical protein